MQILETERLLLREFNIEDAAFIVKLVNSKTWIQFIGDRNIHTQKDAVDYLMNGPLKSYSQNGFGLSLVAIKASQAAIGMCGLIRRPGLDFPDIGFALLPEFEGMGYAFEIAAATMQHARTSLGIEKIVAITTEDNTNSTRLLQKLGLTCNSKVKLNEDDTQLLLFE